MEILFFLLTTFYPLLYSLNINNFQNNQNSLLNSFVGQNLNQDNGILSSLLEYLNKYYNFNSLDQKDMTLFNKCTNKFFNKTSEVDNYLYLLSFSGKELSDLGQETSCIRNGFSYYLLSYDYSLENKISKYPLKIFKFFESKNFYTGLCLFDECNELLQKIFINYKDNKDEDISNTKIEQIIHLEKLGNDIKDKIDCEKNPDTCKYEPYYTLNDKGTFDKDLTDKERKKYKLFYVFFVIIMVLVCLELFVSIFIYCGYYLFNTKNLTNELYEESDLDDDEENSDEEPNEQIIYNNNSTSSKEKKDETMSQTIVKTLYKYFSFVTNIIILTLRKSKFFNNKNMEILTKFRILVILLISFSTNFDVYLKIPSKGFFNDFLYKEFYFVFLKFASFGIDMYICLDGFEVMYKLMNYYKKNYHDKGYKKISFLGLVKFYLFSLYKIVGFIILFFIVNYFNRYYIYIHNGGTLYSYYSNNINNNNINIFQMFNPKYTFLSYFFPSDDTFLFSSKMSLLFINEFIAFTLLLLIFYIGNILKSKIYDYIIIIYIVVSYLLSYPLYLWKNNNSDVNELTEFYTYNKIIRNISLIKYPHTLYNHYLLGAFTGLICFYLKDSLLNNSMINEPEKCPFNFCFTIIEIFEYLVQKGRKIWIFLSLTIQFLLCMTYTIFINLKNRGNKREEEIVLISLKDIPSLIILYCYEAGLFILTFCFNFILIFSHEIETKNYENFNLLNLLNQINFSYVNTIYLLTYSYYCYFVFQLKLTYQNLWFITFGLFIFFCIENLILTIIFIMPLKIVFKTFLDKYLVFNQNALSMEEIKYKNNESKINNSGLSNIGNNYEDELEEDRNEISK